MADFDFQPITEPKTPEPILMKLGMVDYVRDPGTPYDGPHLPPLPLVTPLALRYFCPINGIVHSSQCMAAI